MMVGARTAAGRGQSLPYDAEVEWIESNGEQYVLTNYIPRNVDRIIVKYILYQENHNANSIFASKFGNWDDYPNYWIFLKAADKYQIWAFTNYQQLNISIAYGSVYVCDFDLLNKRIAVYKEGSVPTYKIIEVGVESENQLPIQLFPKGKKNLARTRIMKFEVIRNGEKVADIIAVRKDGVGYMYDRVSGKLFGNAGTGAFVIGPDKTT